MGIYNDYELSLEKDVKGLLKSIKTTCDTAFKASGASISEILMDMDAETGAVVGGCLEIMNKSGLLAIKQARIMDEIRTEVKELRDQNKELKRQNDEMQRDLQRLIKLVEKLENGK